MPASSSIKFEQPQEDVLLEYMLSCKREPDCLARNYCQNWFPLSSQIDLSTLSPNAIALVKDKPSTDPRHHAARAAFIQNFGIPVL